MEDEAGTVEEVVEETAVETAVIEEAKSEQVTQPEAKQNETKAVEGKTFTQDQLNRMMAKEKGQGKSSVYRELGIDPKDAKAIAMVKAIAASQKVDKVEEASGSSSEVIELENRVAMAEAKAEAMVQGANAECVDDIITLALSKVATSESDLVTIIGELKAKYPIWFTSSKAESEPITNKGTGSSVKTQSANNSGAGKDNASLGARLAAQRKGVAKKSSYWGN